LGWHLPSASERPSRYLLSHKKGKSKGIIPAQQEQRAEFNLAFSDGDLQFQYFHVMNTLQTQIPQPLLVLDRSSTQKGTEKVGLTGSRSSGLYSGPLGLDAARSLEERKEDRLPNKLPSISMRF
jgi:hypothetical protein